MLEQKQYITPSIVYTDGWGDPLFVDAEYVIDLITDDFDTVEINNPDLIRKMNINPTYENINEYRLEKAKAILTDFVGLHVSGDTAVASDVYTLLSFLPEYY